MRKLLIEIGQLVELELSMKALRFAAWISSEPRKNRIWAFIGALAEVELKEFK